MDSGIYIRMSINMRELIQTEMDKRHMTQNDISVLLGIASSEVSRYVQGQNPSATRLEYVADKLGYDVLILKRGSKEWRETKKKIGEKDLRQILEEYGLDDKDARIAVGVIRILLDEKTSKMKKAAGGMG